MSKEFIWSVVRRFFRAFLAGGIAQVVLILSTQPVESLTDIKKLAMVVAVGFLSGGAMALDKLLRFDKEKV